MDSYVSTRTRMQTYFDSTAAKTWERLTSDAPVSRIRQTVREGRDTMRAAILAQLPDDLRGARVLDAGCGAGPMSVALAERGADVLGVDISPALLEVATRRTPDALRPRITFCAGDMLDADHGAFDYIVAMDSLIHYEAADIGRALAGLALRTSQSVVFTIAPRTVLLSMMWGAGKAFPRSDRSPQIIPHSDATIAAALRAAGSAASLSRVARVNRGFYISQAMEMRP
ncbi:magnesium protoporphyrin IX methyltransferase [Roseicitreum antarcticum]|uniref:Magnesium protoporphyrin IX methyltransferase n=1 Tax=Roseicitreum antarcticum TaxID=564137 RepID=A0A1H2QLC9_9RHOB|nr:magnesium protoporphyrin IX methyltransferase [Roseicitreum antarcticum]SDW07698.1 Mg-protoporphyrin IX methyltransferase [Roseicitreum antarcticum]